MKETLVFIYKEMHNINLLPISFVVYDSGSSNLCRFYFKDNIMVIAKMNKLKEILKKKLNKNIELTWRINDINDNLIEIDIK